MEKFSGKDELLENIEIEFSIKHSNDETISQYVLEFEGRAMVWDDEEAADIQIGNISGYRIDLSTAQYDQFDLRELFDSVSSELSDFTRTMMPDDKCVLAAMENHGHAEKECDCIVYISQLVVDPEFRSYGVGSALLRKMGAMIDVTDCLIALKAFPLSDELGKAADASYIAKVKRFYEKHGFGHAQGEFMIKDARLCEAVKKRLAQRKKK
jgi:ribosomal protein S18 acetylase RimI-like enzyme